MLEVIAMATSNFDTGLERVKAIFVILGAVAVPLVLGIYGDQIQKNVERASVRASYVRLAADILSKPKENPALRVWAVNVFDAYSPINTPKSLRKGLLHGEVLLPPQVEITHPQNGSLIMLKKQPRTKTPSPGT